ncbi:MAG: hypothetical protein M1831_004538 [Alyxoria varia]|nr:MAG: hypothetical protein M1831_004538 [Alyxoria varia]
MSRPGRVCQRLQTLRPHNPNSIRFSISTALRNQPSASSLHSRAILLSRQWPPSWRAYHGSSQRLDYPREGVFQSNSPQQAISPEAHASFNESTSKPPRDDRINRLFQRLRPPRKIRRFYWYLIATVSAVTGFVETLYFMALFFSIPEEPDTEEDNQRLDELHEEFESLPLVHYLRSQRRRTSGDSSTSGGIASVAAVSTPFGTTKSHSSWQERPATGTDEDGDELVWREWPVYSSFGIKAQSELGIGPLRGSRALGMQRVFWNPHTCTCLLFVNFGEAMAGWPSVVHGGAIATVCEEVGARIVGLAGTPDSKDGWGQVTAKSPDRMGAGVNMPTKDPEAIELGKKLLEPDWSPSTSQHEEAFAPADISERGDAIQDSGFLFNHIIEYYRPCRVGEWYVIQASLNVGDAFEPGRPFTDDEHVLRRSVLYQVAPLTESDATSDPSHSRLMRVLSDSFPTMAPGVLDGSIDPWPGKESRRRDDPDPESAYRDWQDGFFADMLHRMASQNNGEESSWSKLAKLAWLGFRTLLGRSSSEGEKGDGDAATEQKMSDEQMEQLNNSLPEWPKNAEGMVVYGIWPDRRNKDGKAPTKAMDPPYLYGYD